MFSYYVILISYSTAYTMGLYSTHLLTLPDLIQLHLPPYLYCLYICLYLLTHFLLALHLPLSSYLY